MRRGRDQHFLAEVVCAPIDGGGANAVVSGAAAGIAGHFVVDVTEFVAAPASTGENVARHLFSKAPKPQDITEFTRELAMLVGGGLPLDRSLWLLEQQAETPRKHNA